jgi:hypothetical protein
MSEKRQRDYFVVCNTKKHGLKSRITRKSKVSHTPRGGGLQKKDPSRQSTGGYNRLIINGGEEQKKNRDRRPDQNRDSEKQEKSVDQKRFN